MAQEDKEIISQPLPDPWAPPGAMAAQAASIGTGATGAALLVGGGQSSTGTADSMIALLPDPAQLFGRLAHVLGFQLAPSGVWTLGLVLVILSVALNVYSYALRYRYAKRVEHEYATKQAADAAKEKQVMAQAGAGGFTRGDS